MVAPHGQTYTPASGDHAGRSHVARSHQPQVERDREMVVRVACGLVIHLSIFPNSNDFGHESAKRREEALREEICEVFRQCCWFKTPIQLDAVDLNEWSLFLEIDCDGDGKLIRDALRLVFAVCMHALAKVGGEIDQRVSHLPKRHRGDLLEAGCIFADGLGRRRETIRGVSFEDALGQLAPERVEVRAVAEVICAGKAVLHDVDEFLHRVNSGVANFVGAVVEDVVLVVCEIFSMIADILSQILVDVVLGIEPITICAYDAFDVVVLPIFVHVFGRLFGILGRIDGKLANLLADASGKLANVDGGFDDGCSHGRFHVTDAAGNCLGGVESDADAAGNGAADLILNFLGAADDLFPSILHLLHEPPCSSRRSEMHHQRGREE